MWLILFGLFIIMNDYVVFFLNVIRINKLKVWVLI